MNAYPVKFNDAFKSILSTQISESNKKLGFFDPSHFEAFGYFFPETEHMTVRVQMHQGARWAGSSLLRFPANQAQLAERGCEFGPETTADVAFQKLNMPGGMEIVFDFLQNFSDPRPVETVHGKSTTGK